MSVPRTAFDEFYKDTYGEIHPYVFIDLRDLANKEDKRVARLLKEDGSAPPHLFMGQVVYLNIDDGWIEFYTMSSERRKNRIDDWTPLSEKDILEVLEEKIDHRSILPNVNHKTPLEREEEDKKGVTIVPEWTYDEDSTFKGVYLSKVNYEVQLFQYNEYPILRKAVDRRVKELLDKYYATNAYDRHSYENILDNPERYDFETFKKREDKPSTAFCKLRIAQVYADDYKNIKVRVDEWRKKVVSATQADCPTIPNNLREDFEGFFPHQALGLAKLDLVDGGVIDVDMGGGKLLLGVCDILRQVGRGRARRPCMIMPNALIPQQVDEIWEWGDGKINTIVVNTQTENRYGLEELAEMIKAAPPNTIILTSYEWCRKYEEEETGEKGKNRKGEEQVYVENVYVNTRWLLEEAGVDMVTCDESHRLKNPESNTWAGVMSLSKVPIRRIMTGTITPNNPEDVWAQMAFIDPKIFGTREHFRDTYAEQISGSTGRVTKWRDDPYPAQIDIRRRLLENGAVMVRRSAWMQLLPPRHERYHPVSLSRAQQKIYEAAITEIMTEIFEDTKLSKMWAQFQVSDEDEDDKDFGPLLAKLVRLDQFLTAPDSYPAILTAGGRIVIKEALDEKDQVSPKVPKIDEILREHFAQKDHGKVLVFVQNKASARHIIEHSKYTKIMEYYDASVKEVLVPFKKEGQNPMVLVAVDKSLREGQNLQVANRVIRGDLAWNPGDMEQSYGRAWRPKQTRPVFIDILITDNTAEVTKMGRLISKYHTNRQLNSSFEDKDNIEVISMNPDNMNAFRRYDQLQPYFERMNSINKSEKEEAKEAVKVFGDKLVENRLEKKALPGTAKIEETTVLHGTKTANRIEIGHTVHGKFLWFISNQRDVGGAKKSHLKEAGFKYDSDDHDWSMSFKATTSLEQAKKEVESVLIKEYEYEIVWKGEEAFVTDDEGIEKVVAEVELWVLNGELYIAVKAPKDEDLSGEVKKALLKLKFFLGPQMKGAKILNASQGLSVLTKLEEKVGVENVLDLKKLVTKKRPLLTPKAGLGILYQLTRGKQRREGARLFYAWRNTTPMIIGAFRDIPSADRNRLSALSGVKFNNMAERLFLKIDRSKARTMLEKHLPNIINITNQAVVQSAANQIGLGADVPEGKED